MAMLAALPQASMALGSAGQPVIEDAVRPAAQEETPKYHVRFAVCGMSHDHIYGMVGAVQRGGGELVAIWGGEEDKLAIFTKRFPGVKVVNLKAHNSAFHIPKVVAWPTSVHDNYAKNKSVVRGIFGVTKP